jgi:hypothetical protein
MLHGFINMIDLSRSAMAALVEVADEARAMLAGSRGSAPVGSPPPAGEDAAR